MRAWIQIGIVLFLITAVLWLFSTALVPRAKDVADNNDQKANLKNLATACRTAEVENLCLPPTWGEYGRPPKEGMPRRTATVLAHLLPYLESKSLFDSGAFNEANVKVFRSALHQSLPDRAKGHTSFVANLRVFSDYGAETKWNEPIGDLEKCLATKDTTEAIPDGMGNVLLFTTKYAICNGIHNRFYLPPWDVSNGGAYFGAGSHAGGPIPTADIPTGQRTKLPAYQLAPKDCNNDRGIFGHSFHSHGLAVAMGDTSVRNLSFRVTGDTFAKAICPNDGQKLGNDW